MMNPGSSKPLEKTSNLKTSVDSISEKLVKNRLVIARPDKTQYQIMRVMIAKGWKHARIINLSDIREPKSGVFLKRIAKLDTLSIGTTHSIFDRRRAIELKRALDLKSATSPIIVAWGVYRGLEPLARISLTCLSGRQIYGFRKDPELLLYFHPCPQSKYGKMSWLSDILDKLTSCQ